MTRINVGIDPRELPQKALLAEHREIVRIPNTIKSGKLSGKNAPQVFKLNQGHVKFFVHHMGYLSRRYKAIFEETKNRGYNTTDMSDAFNGFENETDYQPTLNDRQILLDRLKERNHILIDINNRDETL